MRRGEQRRRGAAREERNREEEKTGTGKESRRMEKLGMRRRGE